MQKIKILILLLFIAVGTFFIVQENDRLEFLPERAEDYLPPAPPDQAVIIKIEAPYIEEVKYAKEPVTITAEFLTCDTSQSSFITKAVYEPSKQYLIITLNQTSYHYCDLPSSVWEEFCNAESLGSYYNANLKGNYACS